MGGPSTGAHRCHPRRAAPASARRRTTTRLLRPDVGHEEVAHRRAPASHQTAARAVGIALVRAQPEPLDLLQAGRQLQHGPDARQVLQLGRDDSLLGDVHPAVRQGRQHLRVPHSHVGQLDLAHDGGRRTVTMTRAGPGRGSARPSPAHRAARPAMRSLSVAARQSDSAGGAASSGWRVAVGVSSTGAPAGAASSAASRAPLSAAAGPSRPRCRAAAHRSSSRVTKRTVSQRSPPTSSASAQPSSTTASRSRAGSVAGADCRKR